MNRTLLILLLTISTAALAVEDPPNCSLANGGLGNTSWGGISFNVSQAHVGDTVSVFAVMGMVSNACSAINATGSLWIATGHLTNYMVNVTLNPATPGGQSTWCPGTNTLCEPGPYSFVITAPLVGAGVSTPNLTVSGVAKAVRVVANEDGTVQVGTPTEELANGRSTSLGIVTPCIQVSEMCGQSCIGGDVNFTGYVLNCGDITLTNITAVNDRTTLLNLDGSTLSQPFTLTAGQQIPFKGSFTPSGAEASSQSSTNSITVRGTDTTTIGGPYASVTNTITTICPITSCTNCACACLVAQAPVKSPRAIGELASLPTSWFRRSLEP